jgi:hypothetical protein
MSAATYEAALIPANRQEIERELGVLTTATIPWTDHDERDAMMQLEQLIAGLSHVPLDLLKDGCRRYIMKEGKRFFPRSPGELLEFISPALRKRQRRAAHLKATVAELWNRQRAEDARRTADESWTEAEVAEANETFRRCGLETRYRLVAGGRVERVTAAAA